MRQATRPRSTGQSVPKAPTAESKRERLPARSFACAGLGTRDSKRGYAPAAGMNNLPRGSRFGMKPVTPAPDTRLPTMAGCTC
jgi:hypothetical protein